MRRYIIIGTVIAIAAMITLAWSFENFQFVFLAPAVVLLVVQGFALSEATQVWKDKLFGVTDYIYYIGVGAILGVGSHFLAEIDEILRYDATTTYHSAVNELPKVKKSLKLALDRAKSLDQLISTMDQSLFAGCVIVGKDLPSSAACNFIQGISISSARATAEVKDLSDTKMKLEEVINEGPESGKAPGILSRENVFWLLYKFFPALLLCGVSLKIGKTTSSILK